MTYATLGRADLLRALADGADEDRVARLLGYRREAARPEPAPIVTTIDEAPPTPEPTAAPVIQAACLRPIPFWQAVSVTRRSAPDRPVDPSTRIPEWANAPSEAPVFRVLEALRDLTPRLRPAMTARRPTGDINCDKVVEALGRGRVLDPIPRQTARRQAPSLTVILDRSDRLIPYWTDQEVLIPVLRDRAPAHRLEFRIVHEALDPELPMPVPGQIVLVLGDMGALARDSGETAQAWSRLGRQITAAGAHAAALVPCPVSRLPSEMQRDWHIVPWERGGTEGPQDRDSRRQRADALLTLASPAIRIEPGLLRALRHQMPPGFADAGTEADVWAHPAISSGASEAASLDPTQAQGFRAKFAALAPEVQKTALGLIAAWRHGLPNEIWFEEVINLPAVCHGNLPNREDVDAARDYFRFLSNHAGVVGAGVHAVRGYLGRVEARADPDALVREPDLAKAVEGAKVGSHVPAPPRAPIDPIEIPTEEPERDIELRQRGCDVHFNVAGTSGDLAAGSLLGVIRSANGLVRLQAGIPKPPQSFWQSGHSPAWADDWGWDEFGAWVEIFIIGPDGELLRQRMRWAPPGRAQLGSPETEVGRSENETRFWTEFKTGFWMFDTPCTEAVWEAVMSPNADLALGGPFPKTNVMAEDAERFIVLINAAKPGLDLSLPDEAEWEYACRAGTATAYSFGPTITPEQVRFASESAVAVKHLPPNAWGLFGMHGNVWEWCHRYNPFESEGAGEREAHHRVWPAAERRAQVLRGGSWNGSTEDVRAARRIEDVEFVRNGKVGLRCVRAYGAGGAEHDAAPASRSNAEAPFSSVTLRVDSGNGWHLPSSAALIIQSDRQELRLDRQTRPAWATAIGRDRFGLHADFTVPGKEVTQRMRWIPPGRFSMGSPEEEAGRFGDEGPKREVSLQAGYWLFDTPCTQALWQAVLKKNPSRFKSATRPVEQASLDDINQFISILNRKISGLNLTLPSEAEWEYACRAGTTMATYAGDLDLVGENNAPALDPIAWYSGNSGEGFELRNGYDSSEWTEKQFDHKRAGTRPVGIKAPNEWGLYDMLGNVWEWCADTWHDSYNGAPADGAAWIDSGSADRVLRGGSWGYEARDVRAACRDRDRPSYRGDDLGFRCARVQSESEAERRAERIRPSERSETDASSPDDDDLNWTGDARDESRR